MTHHANTNDSLLKIRSLYSYLHVSCLGFYVGNYIHSRRLKRLVNEIAQKVHHVVTIIMVINRTRIRRYSNVLRLLGSHRNTYHTLTNIVFMIHYAWQNANCSVNPLKKRDISQNNLTYCVTGMEKLIICNDFIILFRLEIMQILGFSN